MRDVPGAGGGVRVPMSDIKLDDPELDSELEAWAKRTYEAWRTAHGCPTNGKFAWEKQDGRLRLFWKAECLRSLRHDGHGESKEDGCP